MADGKKKKKKGKKRRQYGCVLTLIVLLTLLQALVKKCYKYKEQSSHQISL